ncbi:c-type cytochrome biogenesis protein CcmI [Paraglaciecola sp. 25GB23A]|uniref:c-type cytochrome biogenesis protein CcmI n=1 Tax=Paraglaciecola sp. 25GB23A TaxID=3156068 RepID=UPI0032AF8A99
MSEFLIGASVLLLGGVLLVCLPWLRRSKKAQQDVLTNTRLIKQRLAELTVEQSQGLLSETDRLQAEQELKLALLDEVKVNVVGTGQTIWILSVGLIIALVIAGSVYFKANQLQQINHWQTAVTQLNALGQTINSGQDIQGKDLQDFALGLRTKLHKDPEDATGWMLLGRVWGALNQPNTAKEAFEKSLALEPDSVGTLLSYAQALILLGTEDELKQARRVLQRVITLDPNNINATGTLAIVSAELGDNQRALQYWLKLQSFLPKDDPNYAAVQQKINEFQGIGQNDGELAKAQAGEQGGSKRVQITINVSDELKAKLPDSGVLFVFAQDPTGQVRMPAAVVKLPLGKFPVTVELSDANAMMPTYTLSGLSTAKLVARISRDDNVMQAAGELQGEIILELQADKLVTENIMINKEIM